jgi:hypothetical protein
MCVFITAIPITNLFAGWGGWRGVLLVIVNEAKKPL